MPYCGVPLYLFGLILEANNASTQHGYGTRSARGGLHHRDHRSVGYRIPREWGSLTVEQRGMGSLAGFKRGTDVSPCKDILVRNENLREGAR